MLSQAQVNAIAADCFMIRADDIGDLSVEVWRPAHCSTESPEQIESADKAMQWLAEALQNALAETERLETLLWETEQGADA